MYSSVVAGEGQRVVARQGLETFQTLLREVGRLLGLSFRGKLEKRGSVSNN